MPDRNAHHHPVGGETLHEPSAEEPGAAEHGDCGHDIPALVDDDCDLDLALNVIGTGANSPTGDTAIQATSVHFAYLFHILLN